MTSSTDANPGAQSSVIMCSRGIPCWLAAAATTEIAEEIVTMKRDLDVFS